MGKNLNRKEFVAKALVAAAGLGVLAGCGGLPGDPIIDDLHTKNVYPGSDVTYDIGASGNAYLTAYINNVICGGLWDDLRTPINAIKLGGVNPPTEISYRGSLVYVFGDKILAQEQQVVYFSVQLPHTYMEGSDLIPHVHWVAEDGTVGNAVWLLTYSWANIDGAFPVEQTITSIGANHGENAHNVANFSVIDGTDKNISSMLLCSLKRNSSNVLDTLNGKNVYLIEIDFHYQVDTFGSINVYPK